MKTNIAHISLIFILIIFMATSGVVTSPSVFNTTASNNLEKVFATTANEQGQEEQPETPEEEIPETPEEEIPETPAEEEIPETPAEEEIPETPAEEEIPETPAEEEIPDDTTQDDQQSCEAGGGTWENGR